jgi:hypothetical protein
VNQRIRTSYAYGRQSPAWRAIGFFALLIVLAWLSLLGFYDVLMWVAEAVRGG